MLPPILYGALTQMYSLLRNLLFQLDAETSHELSLDMLAAAERLKLLSLFANQRVKAPVEVMGLRFPNPVGLAAGLDKNGDFYNALGEFGFGSIEIGTVTPQAQPGNPKPRMFRLQEDEAIINRMGFNSKGVGHLLGRVQRRRYNGILGINLGKNKLTPEEKALDDYLLGMEHVYGYADYICINISSPNTPGLRNLQFGDSLDQLVEGIEQKRKQLADKYGKRVPLTVKVAPDNENEDIKFIVETLIKHDIDGIVATNTTVSREGLANIEFASEAGGLSGAPLTERSTEVIRQIKMCVGDDLPIIGVGGIMSGEDAKEKLDAGASLVQIYSGFIYRGPKLIGEIVDAL
jgi:dihydroorotate dehydrogenase